MKSPSMVGLAILSVALLLSACGPSSEKPDPKPPENDETIELTWDEGNFDESTWAE